MNEREKQIERIVASHASEYGLQFLKDMLKSGLRHVGEVGLMNVPRDFVKTLTVLEAAIERLELTDTNKHAAHKAA